MEWQLTVDGEWTMVVTCQSPDENDKARPAILTHLWIKFIGLERAANPVQ